jgi:hypothetical protein
LKRLLPLGLCVLCLSCRLPEEREALKPLPEKGVVLPYHELQNRAKIQADAALAAFYADNWLELEQVAQVLEQTARYLPDSSDAPTNMKKVLAKEAESLRTQAVRLRDAAKAKNVQTINDSLQQIHLTVRALRPPE